MYRTGATINFATGSYYTYKGISQSLEQGEINFESGANLGIGILHLFGAKLDLGKTAGVRYADLPTADWVKARSFENFQAAGQTGMKMAANAAEKTKVGASTFIKSLDENLANSQKGVVLSSGGLGNIGEYADATKRAAKDAADAVRQVGKADLADGLNKQHDVPTEAIGQLNDEARRLGKAAGIDGLAEEAVAQSRSLGLSWPPKKPVGAKPELDSPDAAAWRYERYRYEQYGKGKSLDQILAFNDWKKRHFEPTKAGGRPGREGTRAHADDVLRNNDENDLVPMDIGNGLTPDGVGKPGQTVTIRGQTIKPEGNGRVMVESDRTVFNGQFPESAARQQVRNYRKASPNSTIIVTNPDQPSMAPLVYPPGTQPPPAGVIGRNHATHVPSP